MYRDAALFLLFTGVIVYGGQRAYALPPPCQEAELTESSQFAVEGRVENVECGEPYESGQCRPQDSMDKDFVPELFSDCSAAVRVSKTIKGVYKPGDIAEVPFTRVARQCVNGEHMIPGSPTADLKTGMYVRYYDSGLCRYWNLRVLAPPTPGPE